MSYGFNYFKNVENYKDENKANNKSEVKSIDYNNIKSVIIAAESGDTKSQYILCQNYNRVTEDINAILRVSGDANSIIPTEAAAQKWCKLASDSGVEGLEQKINDKIISDNVIPKDFLHTVISANNGDLDSLYSVCSVYHRVSLDLLHFLDLSNDFDRNGNARYPGIAFSEDPLRKNSGKFYYIESLSNAETKWCLESASKGDHAAMLTMAYKYQKMKYLENAEIIFRYLANENHLLEANRWTEIANKICAIRGTGTCLEAGSSPPVFSSEQSVIVPDATNSSIYSSADKVRFARTDEFLSKFGMKFDDCSKISNTQLTCKSENTGWIVLIEADKGRICALGSGVGMDYTTGDTISGNFSTSCD